MAFPFAYRRGLGLGIGLQRRTKTIPTTPPTTPANTVAPAITGTPTVSLALTCSQGTWTNSPSGYAYQWQRNGINISEATTNTYTLVNADAGLNITCQVTATNGSGSTTATSNAIVANGGPVNIVAPVASGTPTVGQTLGCTGGTWIGVTPITVAFQWQRNTVNIAGATTSSYTLVSADAGTTIRCVVTASSAAGSSNATSNSMALTDVPTIVTDPVVTGGPYVGQLLSCTTGSWTNSPSSYAYQWRRSGVDIAGATSNTYTPVSADGGTNVTCIVTATNSSGNGTPVVSNSIAVNGNPLNTVAPAITGTTNQSKVLTCSTGTWLGATPTFSYQWKRGGTDISGATANTYTLLAADVGQTITCLVTATNSFSAVSQISNTTATIAAWLAISLLGENVGTTSAVVTGTPLANTTLIAAIVVRRNGTTVPNAPTLNDGVNTWTLIAQNSFAPINGLHVALYKTTIGASPVALTITAASASATSMGLSICQVLNMAADFSNISPPAQNTSADSSPVLPNSPEATSIIYGVQGQNGGSSITLPGDFVQLGTWLAPSGARLSVCNDNSPSGTGGNWSSNGAESIGYFLELKAA